MRPNVPSNKLEASLTGAGFLSHGDDGLGTGLTLGDLSRFLSDVIYLGSTPIRISEFENTHTTMGVIVGGGVRLPVGSRLSIVPELGIYDGTILAGPNLTQFRTSIGIGYRR